jgi:hypothetical protein
MASIVLVLTGIETILPSGISVAEKYERYSFCGPFCIGITVAIYIPYEVENL